MRLDGMPYQLHRFIGPNGARKTTLRRAQG
jgi:ABC-type branched-subunit amino acid transport system ATPase component